MTVSFPSAVKQRCCSVPNWPGGPTATAVGPRKVPEARLADGRRTHAQESTVPHGLTPYSRKPAARLPPFLALPSMPLLLTGRRFREDLEKAGALALYAPLEGGAETRLMRRLRAAGYRAQMTSARGLGDPEVFLLQSHGIRPPHLGHHSVGNAAAVGDVQQVMPQLGPLLEGTKPILLWLLEAQVLSVAELSALCGLTQREPRLRIVAEMGGSRSLRWRPLDQCVAA